MLKPIKFRKVDVRDGEPGQKHSRIFVFPRSPGSNLFGLLDGSRWVNPSKDYRKRLFPTLLKKLKIDSDTSIVWSQKAGCSCGCSPGFIVKDGQCKNYFINIYDYAK